MKAIELEPGSLAELSTALDEAQADVDQIMSSAASEFDSEIEALRTATQALKTSVEAATQAPSGPAITEAPPLSVRSPMPPTHAGGGRQHR